MTENPDYWTSPTGLLKRTEWLADNYTVQTYNTAVQVIGAKNEVWGFEWVVTIHTVHTCDYCDSQSGRQYRAGQFMPELPVHPNCHCEWRPIYKEKEPTTSPPSLQIPKDLLQKDNITWQPQKDGKTIGHIEFNPKEGDLWHFILNPEERGKGYGSEILKNLEDTAREAGAKQMKVWVMKGFEDFYKKMGYTIVNIPNIPLPRAIKDL